MATATIISPLQTRGMMRAFSSSPAKCSIARTGPTLDSKMGNATAEEILANSSSTSSASTLKKAHFRIASQVLPGQRAAIGLHFFRHRGHLLAGEPACGLLQHTLFVA
jgi:hypothetical protein